jgi:mycothiol maleylpyruvate isomerase-like protein
MAMEAKARAAIEDRNHAAVDRLRALGARLSDEELIRTIDPPWTAAALFAHMAFWDRFVHARWLLAANSGARTPLHFDDALLELINDAALQQWAVIPPRAAIQDCLAAATEIDALIGSLETDVVSEVVIERRERLVDRSLHRGEHLSIIETAFP